MVGPRWKLRPRCRYPVLLVVWALALLLLGGSIVFDQRGQAAPEHDDKHKRRDGVRRIDGEVQTPYYLVGHMRCKRGEEVTSNCTCVEGYTGESCVQAICPGGCSQHGQCLRPGYCTCEEGWRGRQCDEPTCKQRCVHGHCHYPNFCRCNSGWYGRRCDKQCSYGVFSQRSQACECSEGWRGEDCRAATCDIGGCVHGYCTEPEKCDCFLAWSGGNCTSDLAGARAEDLTKGLVFKSRRWPALLVHNSGKKFDETWKSIKKWTSGLQEEWKFGRTRFTNEVPANDTLLPRLANKYKTCVAVGNSGSLLSFKAGRVIDAHQAVLRYNGGPTKGFEDHVGKRTTLRLLNRKHVDSLVSRQQARASAPPPPPGKKPPRPRRPSRETTLLWRAESYQHYAVLRRLLPEDQIFMVSPEFLLPLLAFFKNVMQRMEGETGFGSARATQSTPHGFVGIGLLMQICDRVSVYGFDEPRKREREGAGYHYFDKVEPLDPHASDVKFAVLRILDSLGLIRLCLPEENMEACLGEDEVHWSGVNVAS